MTSLFLGDYFKAQSFFSEQTLFYKITAIILSGAIIASTFPIFAILYRLGRMLFEKDIPYHQNGKITVNNVGQLIKTSMTGNSNQRNKSINILSLINAVLSKEKNKLPLKAQEEKMNKKWLEAHDQLDKEHALKKQRPSWEERQKIFSQNLNRNLAKKYPDQTWGDEIVQNANESLRKKGEIK